MSAVGVVGIILLIGTLYVIYQFTKAFVYIILHLDKKSRVQSQVMKSKSIRHKQHDYWDEPGGLQYVQLPDGSVRID